MSALSPLPDSLFGLGLRAKHYPYIFEHLPPVGWFEIISENFMDTEGKPARNLDRIREHYPVVMHGVSLSIGTADPLRSDYLKRLKALIKRTQPLGVSDHLCWTGTAHQNSHDLLPVPYTEAALKHLVQRVKEVQDALERPLALENPSTYLQFSCSAMPEAEFMARLAEDSGCRLLLDVNNVYVTCFNHGLDAKAYLDTLPMDHVVQIHLAGHRHKGTHIIDTHDEPVIPEVLRLFAYALQRAGRAIPVMIERDDAIPEFPVLMAELETVKRTAAKALGKNTPLPQKRHAKAPMPCGTEPPADLLQTRMLQAVTEDGPARTEARAWLRPNPRFPAKAQLDVYSASYAARLFDVTSEDYPVLRHYLGKDAFGDLIRAFVASERADHYHIGRFAQKLPAFVKRRLPDDAPAYEMAELECAVTRVADLAETPPLCPEHLAGLTAETLPDLRLTQRAALELHAFAYPVNRYYIHVMNDRTPAPPTTPEACHVAVFRHEDTVWRLDLEHDEYKVLKRLFDGATIGEALDGMPDSASADISRWFSRWITNGLPAAA